MLCWSFLEFADILQMSAFSRQRFSQHFSRVTQVAAQLLHPKVWYSAFAERPTKKIEVVVGAA
jgi:hypothetical protein